MSDAASSNPTPHDFKKPSQLPGDIHRCLTSWQSVICEAMVEKLNQYIAFSTSWQPGPMATARPSAAIDQLSDSAVGYQINLTSSEAVTLCVFPRQLMLIFIGGMLGDGDDELPEDRPLTQVEHSLGEMIAQELSAAIDDSWAGSESMTSKVHSIEPKPKRTRLFLDNDSVVSADFSVTGSFGSQTVQWLISEEAIDRVITTGTNLESNESDKSQLMNLVTEIPVRLVAKLGQTTMHASQLAGLRLGDVIIFDQRVSDPLTLNVEDKVKFRGWPGQIGTRQALYIETAVDS